tara:strand:- start:10686 stop:11426 length:741 start_codon:yes stop_codon:yes gene_type:complete
VIKKIFPKIKDGYIGYDAHFSSKHLFSDNPDFRGLFNRTGYNHDYEFEVDYQFNEYGHRSEALIGGQNHFLVIGGSQTFGLGVPIEKTYPDIIGQYLGLDYYNLSLPIASNDVNIFNLIWYLSRRIPLFVIWEWTFDSRNSLILEDDTVLPLQAMMVENQEKEFNIGGLTQFFTSADEVGYNKSRRMMYEGILNNLVPKKIELTGSDIRYKDVSRDGEHWGVNTHIALAFDLMGEHNLERYSNSRG